MKAAQITLLFLVVIILISWSRGHTTHTLPMVLPLLHGGKVGIYDAASAVMVGIGLAGLMRLARNRRKDGNQK